MPLDNVFPFSSLKSLVVASHNQGKVREISELLHGHVQEVYSAAELGLDEPEETGSTFEANAGLKAKAAMQATGMVALADDSGLEVEALDNAPGIYSARWGGAEKNFNTAMQRVLSELAASKSPQNRRARFVCALCLSFPETHVSKEKQQTERYINVQGEFHGHLAEAPRGGLGFGYDPLFIPNGYTQTCGELDPTLKNNMSHRADAFNKLRALLLQHQG